MDSCPSFKYHTIDLKTANNTRSRRESRRECDRDNQDNHKRREVTLKTITIMAKRPRQINSRRPGLDLRQLMLLLPILATKSNANPIDYTCNPYDDFAEDNACLTVNDGRCDNPNHGGNGGEACRNQDCIDCTYHCKNKSIGR